MSSNPAYIGPGYWAAWHIKAMKADTRDKKVEVARNISIDVLNFPCDVCNKDAKEYIKNNSMLPHVDNPKPLSLFNWTVDFHNYVNIKLRKKIGKVSHEQAYLMWDKNSLCIKNCGLTENDILDEEVKSYEDNTDDENTDEENTDEDEKTQNKIVMQRY